MVKSKRGSRTLAIAVIAAMIMSLFAAFPGFARAQETLDKDNLKDGTYEVSVALWNETKDQASMAASTIGDTATIEVKDGTASMTIQALKAKIMGFDAQLQGMKVFEGTSTAEGQNNTEAVAGEADENGTIPYTFTMPHMDEYIYVSVNPGPPMNAWTGARIKVDWNTLKLIEEATEPGTDPGDQTNPGEGEGTETGGEGTDQEKPETPSVDKSGLQSAYDAVAAMTQGNYTADSWADFVSARDAAKAILDNKDATADQVTKAIKDLQTAKDALAYDNILNLADGTYKVPVKLWHETKDQASMAASSVLPEAMITVSGKDIKMNIYTQPMTMGTITASLQTLKVENGTGGYTDADIVGRSSSGDPNEFSFALPHAKEYINVLVNPKVAIMGNTDIGARLKVDYSSIAKVENAESDINANATTTTATPNSPKTGDEAPMALLATLMLLSGGIGVYAYRKR